MAKDPEVQAGQAPEPAKFKIVGLKEADYMPVSFGGTIYDLKKLSEEAGEMLIKAKYPHLVKI